MSLDQRKKSLQKLKHAFENIFEKYDKPFDDTDVIDLMELKVVDNNGFLDSIEPKPLGGLSDHVETNEQPQDEETTAANLLHTMKNAKLKLLQARTDPISTPSSIPIDHVNDYQNELDAIQDFYVMHQEAYPLYQEDHDMFNDCIDIERLYLKCYPKPVKRRNHPKNPQEPEIPDSIALQILEYHCSSKGKTAIISSQLMTC